MSWIQDQLLAKAAGFTGDLLGEFKTPIGLERAVIHRGSVTNGPEFSPFSAGSWLPPQIDKIREKLVDKRYQTTAPLELFTYALHDEPDGAVGAMEQIDEVVRAHLPGSRFRRVPCVPLRFWASNSHLSTLKHCRSHETRDHIYCR
jgi:hypothetical protein